MGLKDWAKSLFAPATSPQAPPTGMSNAIGTGQRSDEIIGIAPSAPEPKKKEEPAAGKYKHNSPAEPL